MSWRAVAAKKIAKVLAAWTTFALATVLSATASPKDPPPVPALNVLADPGPEPSLDPSEYDAYRKPGTSQIVGRAEVPGREGKNEVCRGAEVVLYPNTAFTRWAIATWVRRLDGARFRKGLYRPGDTATGFTVPSYLDPMNLAAMPTSALRLGRCDWSNGIVVDRIAEGKYILVTTVMRDEADVRERSGQVIVNTPYGEHPESVDGGWYLGGTLGDGYVLATRSELNVRAGRSYTFSSDNFRPVAHFAP